NGHEVWVCDGTKDGTKLLADLVEGTGSSFPNVGMAVGNRIVFTASLTSTVGYELFTTDGTPSGTKLLKDIFTGTTSGYAGHMRLLGNRIFFVGTTPWRGVELWETDGTTEGTLLNLDLKPGEGSSLISSLYVYDNKLFFAANFESVDYELYSVIPGQGTSIQKVSKNGMIVYPNPIKAGNKLNLNDVLDGSIVTLTSAEGKSTQLELREGQAVIPSEMPQGIYILSIQTETGIQTSKISIHE